MNTGLPKTAPAVVRTRYLNHAASTLLSYVPQTILSPLETGHEAKAREKRKPFICAAMFPRALSFASIDERRKTRNSPQSKFTWVPTKLPRLRFVYILSHYFPRYLRFLVSLIPHASSQQFISEVTSSCNTVLVLFHKMRSYRIILTTKEN